MTSLIPSEAPKFTFAGLRKTVRISSVYDGDTFHVIFKPFESEGYFSISCRALGYNSAELRTHDLIEKEKGYASRDFLRNLILGKEFQAEFHEFDKYGRPLIDLSVPQENSKEFRKLSEVMIESGHGAPYFGHGEKKF